MERPRDPEDFNDYDAESDDNASTDNGDPRNPPDPTPGALIPIDTDLPFIEREIQKPID